MCGKRLVLGGGSFALVLMLLFCWFFSWGLEWEKAYVCNNVGVGCGERGRLRSYLEVFDCDE